MSIEKAYNLWASQYDTNDNKTRDLDKIATSQTLEKYNFTTVLELGCGTGKNTLFLLGKANHIIGIDFSQEMMNKAKEKVDKFLKSSTNKEKKVQFQKADLTKEWNVPGGFADLITCSLTLEHIQNLNFIFNQANKKLRTNGLFFICELHPFKQYLGSRARFDKENGTVVLETYTHHLSEYLSYAKKNGFVPIEINEWFDAPESSNSFQTDEVPRLISFVFEKGK